jgi:hypothetical protein
MARREHWDLVEGKQCPDGAIHLVKSRAGDRWGIYIIWDGGKDTEFTKHASEQIARDVYSKGL